MNDQALMQMALSEARAAMAAGEVPVGAVVVRHGQVIATGRNSPMDAHDPTAHAEINAIRAAAQVLGNYRLDDCEMYVTLEPCAMCAAAIAAARLERVVYGASDPKSGGVEHGARVFSHPQAHHRPEVVAGVAEAESAALLKDFFAGRR